MAYIITTEIKKNRNKVQTVHEEHQLRYLMPYLKRALLLGVQSWTVHDDTLQTYEYATPVERKTDANTEFVCVVHDSRLVISRAILSAWHSKCEMEP